jgi:hypothetical protein
MRQKCSKCSLVCFSAETHCPRCQTEFTGESQAEVVENKPQRWFFRLISAVVSSVIISFLILCIFYGSLLKSSEPLSPDQSHKISLAIDVLEQKGFSREVFLLRNLASYRSTDHWFNQATRQDRAYAATNFPFEIITVYPEFFLQPVDETEQAVILLHEAQHLHGAGEEEAYEYVWRNRYKLGWTKKKYGKTKIWHSVYKVTRELLPKLFTCEWNEDSDCTEMPKELK